MTLSRIVCAAAAALAALLPIAAVAADDAATQALKAQLARIQTLRAERPGDGLLAYYQALTHVQLGEREAALAELRGLLGRRLGLLPVPTMGFAPLSDDVDFRVLRARLAADEPATPEAPVTLQLGGAPFVAEGVAWDAARRRYFVGDVQGRILAVPARRDGGTATPRVFSSPGDRLDAVLGLAVAHGSLYAVSTNGFLDAAQQGRRNALLRYDLASGRLSARHDVAQALQLNDVTVAADGTVYLTDTLGGTLFRLRPGEPQPTPFGPAGALRGANGLALSGDGKVLYVAVSTGIARVDLRDGTVARLPQPDDVVSGGIDGLYWHDGALLGVQNATNPGRVIRLALADGGTRIAGVTVLQSHHHPQFDVPTTGTLVGRSLVVLANSQIQRLGADGRVDAAQPLTPLLLLAVPTSG